MFYSYKPGSLGPGRDLGDICSVCHLYSVQIKMFLTDSIIANVRCVDYVIYIFVNLPMSREVSF